MLKVIVCYFGSDARMVMTAHIFVVLVLVWLELMFLLGLRIHLSRVFFFKFLK
jgi:hypothetical protein